MRILKSLLAVLTARWFWTLIGSLLLAGLIWFFGDLLALGELRPFESDTAKLVGILVVAVLWGLSNLFSQLRARRRNAGLVAELAAPATRPDPADAELAELARRFSGALDQLKQRRLGTKGNRRWLYQLPWYAMIGPPGSGKTTALVQSGLRFPLAQARELRGVAGTRYCDWFFTDEAVLIDTAGRYTSQDSDRDGDAKAWRGFLELLRKRRPRQPLNGILVALAVTDLIEGQRGRGGIDHAAAVRARLTEIDSVLGMRLPVYLLLTKADLIAGFGEFFGQLGERERAQVWGVTLPYATSGGPDTAALEQEFGGLVERLDRMTPGRLAGERDLERRALVMGFSAQVQALVPDLLRFVEAAFGSSSFEAQPALRGVYLTSGTQAGTPVDRLAAAIGRSLGLPQEAPQPQASDRSFFLTRLLRDVVFAEASLAGQDLGGQRSSRILRAAAMAGMAALLVAAVAAWTLGFVANRDRQFAQERALTEWIAQAEPIAKHRLAAPDAALAPVLPALDQVAQLQIAAAQPLPWYQRLGLSQQGLLEAQAGVAYRKALRDILLPRLVLRLERQMAVRIDEPDYLLEALKVYLMLGGRAPADGDLVAGWFALDLQHNDPALADPMAPHLAALANELPGIEARPTLDAGLLARAQTTIAKIPLAKRAWEALLASDAVHDLPPWTITEHAGPNASATLVRRSGRPLGAPVSGIFTHAGFYEVFLPILPETAQAALAENWVLGSTQAPEPSPAQVARLQDDLVKLYEDDAIEAWEGVLRDVTLAPMGSLDQAVDATKALSGPNSPLKLLAQSIVAETSLAQPPAADPADAAADPAKMAQSAGKALGKLGSKLGKLSKLLGTQAEAAPAGSDGPPPGAAVEAHFQYLRDLVQGVDGAPPKLDEALAALGNLNEKLNQAALSPNPGEAFARMGPTGAAQLAKAAGGLPEPLNQMLAGVAQKAVAISAGGIRQQVNDVWQTDVTPFCAQALSNRFPFAPASGNDAALDDVQRLFASGGLIDGFVNDHLAQLVDTSRRPWRPNPGSGLAAGSLAQLERARRIGRSLFPAGTFQARFTLTPLDLDNDSASVTLDLDGQKLSYAHGPSQPKNFTWPGPAGTGIVRISFAPLGGGAPVIDSVEGPWSLFRLLQRSQMTSGGQPDLFEVTLAAAGHSARFKLKAGSVDNPFDLSLLGGFACPNSL